MRTGASQHPHVEMARLSFDGPSCRQYTEIKMPPTKSDSCVLLCLSGIMVTRLTAQSPVLTGGVARPLKMTTLTQISDKLRV